MSYNIPVLLPFQKSFLNSKIIDFPNLKTKPHSSCFNFMKMTIKEDHIITITYELREKNEHGELLERMDARYPFIFYFGNGKLLPEFEKQLFGLSEDASFEFALTPDQAYGKSNALNILKIPKEDFVRASDIPSHYIQVDNMVNLTDDDGILHTGKIKEIEEDHVKVDFNHIMVDKTLHFKGAILSIRKATVEEMVKGFYLESEDVNHR